MRILLLLLFLTSSVCGQINATSVQIKNTELAERMPAVIEDSKPNSMNLDNIKGFVLTTLSISNTIMTRDHYRNNLKREFENTFFEFSKRMKKNEKFKEGYIYLSYSFTNLNNNNKQTTWVFRDHNRRTLYSFTATNMTDAEVLSKIGISTY